MSDSHKGCMARDGADGELPEGIHHVIGDGWPAKYRQDGFGRTLTLRLNPLWSSLIINDRM